MSAARVGVIGARRRRQGLGPFVVRDLSAAGAEVPCFLATSESSRDAAERELAERCGVEARGYADLDRMLACESLDALAILSPAESHARYLAAALDANLHTLCEKPFVWGRLDLAASAARFAADFAERGLLLFENCQWPYTLPAYRTLHPEALAQPPRHFEMLLQPASRGLQMLGDCVPHVLSLLQAAAPGAQSSIEELRYRVAEPDADHIRLEFVFRTELAEIRSVVDLEHSGNHPRQAAYGFDGRLAQRLVCADGYRLSFAADGREVPLEDPLTLLVANFVRAISRADPRASRHREIATRMELLERIVAAYPHPREET